MNPKGFYHDPDADPQQWLFGSGNIQATPIRSDRQWIDWLPEFEDQLRNGFDPLSCASYGSLNLIEIYLRAVFGVERNYSDRWLAYRTDTEEKHGNDPHLVLEFLRTAGDVPEQQWPLTPEIDSFEKYYAMPPYMLEPLALQLIKEWDLTHETVRQGSYAALQDAMWDALQYSPLGVSTGLNAQDDKGYWYKDSNEPDWHWCCIVGGAYGDHFLIFDSANGALKKAAWSKLNPLLCKRISVRAHVGSPAYSILDGIKAALNAVFALLPALFAPKKPMPPADMPDPPNSAVEQNLAPDGIPASSQPEAPPVAKYEWDTPQKAKHSVRVICDEEGLTVPQKNDLCATIGAESGWQSYYVLGPKKGQPVIHENVVSGGRVWSTDYGICQINDHFNIGTGKPFPSAQFVLDNPEVCVRWMSREWKAGHSSKWNAYTSGLYRQFL
jgi:hypothetical protein